MTDWASATTWESLKRKHLGVTLTQLAWQETFFEEPAMSKKETGSNDAARWLKPSAREFLPARSLTNLASLCVRCNSGSHGPDVAAHRQRRAAGIETAPPRRPFPRGWRLDLQAHPQGRLVFLRRSNERGEVQLLGRTFAVDPLWQHRLVRAEVDLKRCRIRFYTLRRRAPDQQSLVKETCYVLPRRKFTE